ncbi:Os08g0176900, partial [Oryza sativa Japonica Group]
HLADDVQADHLRQETLQNMYKILTLPQAARGLLALGDYCQRLRALSSLWAARPREPA